MLRRTSCAGPAGFTVVEILLAVSLGALLLMATAGSAGMFGTQLSALEEETDVEVQSALASVADDTRYAWTATVPNSRKLVLTDPQGDQTTFAFNGSALEVTRPDGTQGELLDDLKSATFNAETTTRFREAPPVTRTTAFWTATAPAGTVQATVVDVGDELALGFTPASPAPTGGSPTPGVTEQFTTATFETVSLPLVSLPPLAIGATVTLSLYRARSPLDGRPSGAAVASTTVLASALPAATSWIWNTKTKKKVNPPKKAVWGWWKANTNLTLVVTPPAAATSFDVSALATQVEPGYAYTLVLEPSGSGVALASYATGSASQTGIALSQAGGAFTAQSLAVERSLSGAVTMTRTTATDVVRRVLISLEDDTGTELTGSATVIGQSLAEDAWLGVVPGETAP